MFLTNKLGPLPVWGWGAIAGGALLLFGGHKATQPKGYPGPAPGSVSGTEPQNKGLTIDVNAAGYGSLDSKINGSFFGNGVVELASLNMEDVYSDVFPVGMGGQIRSLGGVPSGAGGIGTHTKRWEGEAPPVGGEGYQNYGQGTGPRKARNTRPIGLNFHEHHHGGGGPHPQKTTMGSPIHTYMTQHGDNMHNVANKLWGPGQNGTLIHQANPGIAGSPDEALHPGHMLNIPAAPPIGLAPSGVAGNGVGAGTWTTSTRARGMGKGQGMGIGATLEADAEAGKMGVRPRPGKAGHRRREGRG